MMHATFHLCYDRLHLNEGGYVNDPRDPGGETKYGISKRSYPHLDIATLTEDDARKIYWTDFWGPAGCDALPASIKFDMFDTAVNSGIKQAVKLLQRACGVIDDGILGSHTIHACNSMDHERLVARFCGWRLDFMNDLKTWPTFGRGWSQRIAESLKRI